MPLEIDITLKNYRCFADKAPATIHLRPGFTAFVGKNNSGKSSVLRFFYEFRQLFRIAGDMSNIVEAARGNARTFNLPPSVPDPASLACDHNDRDIEIAVAYRNGAWNSAHLPQRIELAVRRGTNQWTATLFESGGQRADARALQSQNDNLVSFNTGWQFSAAHWRDVCATIANCFYIGAHRNLVNVGTKQNYYDINIGQAFIQQWREQQTGGNKAHRDAIVLLTKSIRDIFEFDTLEIQASKDEESLRMVVNGKSLDLLEMGSGLAQFIIVLANLSVRQTSYILIDEPESSLHASLQMDFLTTLGSYASEGVFFATHGYGLARSSADWIYGVSKNADGTSTVNSLEQATRLNEFLGALSFSQVPELGFNKILLVESPHDGRAFQQWLRYYRKEHLILLLPLGGSTLINGAPGTRAQLEEIQRITHNISALVDSELTAAGAQLSGERAGFRQLCAELNIRCHLTERRALENYLTQDALNTAIGGGHTALGAFDPLVAANPGWAKRNNWLIARAMTKDDVDATDIGHFLAEL